MLLQYFATDHITLPTVHLPFNFGVAFLFFLKIVLNSSYSTRRHCSYSSYSFFFFGGLPVVLFYFLFFIFCVYCYAGITNFTIFLQLLMCQFFISQNKKTKYETVTNHN